MRNPSTSQRHQAAAHACALLCFFGASATWASDATVPLPETVAPSMDDAPNDTSGITQTRHWLRHSVEHMAAGVDSLFGDKPFQDGGKVTHGELGIRLYQREDESTSLGIRFRARFHLPNLASYQYVFIGNDDRKDIVSDQPDEFSRQEQLLRNDKRDNTFFAGIGANFLEHLDARLGLRGGLKPYAQIRYQRPWQISPHQKIEFKETIFYSRDDRFGSTTSLSYQHALSPSLTARWLGALTATQSEKDAAWSNNLGVYKNLGLQRTWAIEALINGVVGDPVKVADYGIQTKWTQPVYGQQLMGEFIVGHFWPRTDRAQARSQAWAVGTSISLKF